MSSQWYKYRASISLAISISSFANQSTSTANQLVNQQPSYTTAILQGVYQDIMEVFKSLDLLGLCLEILGISKEYPMEDPNLPSVALNHCQLIQRRLVNHKEIYYIRVATDMAHSVLIANRHTDKCHLSIYTYQFLQGALPTIVDAMIKWNESPRPRPGESLLERFYKLKPQIERFRRL